MIKVIILSCLILLSLQLVSCSSQIQKCDCTKVSNQKINQGDKKMNNMLDEIYTYPEPRNFDIKDVRHVVEKYIKRGSTKQQVIDILTKQYKFEIKEGAIENGYSQIIYANYKKGMPLFDMPATIIYVQLIFDVEQDSLSDISATYKVNQ
jgi:hypothetical protein